MSQPSPFAAPEGNPPPQQGDRRARAKLLVFAVLAAHVMVLVIVLLIQGCIQSGRSYFESEEPSPNEPTSAPAAVAPTTPRMSTNAALPTPLVAAHGANASEVAEPSAPSLPVSPAPNRVWP